MVLSYIEVPPPLSRGDRGSYDLYNCAISLITQAHRACRSLRMTRSLCLLVLCLLPFAVQNQAQNTKTSRTHRSTAVEPRVEMSLRDGWCFKLGPGSATELQAEPDGTW